MRLLGMQDKRIAEFLQPLEGGVLFVVFYDYFIPPNNI